MEPDVTILYVDDEIINLQVFEINFKKKYKVISAQSGIEALDKLDDDNSIIVVVSDMRMPGMNGIEFIEKARRKHKNIIYFILTGFDITGEIYDALDNNTIQKYFNKPLNMEEISRAIDEALISI